MTDTEQATPAGPGAAGRRSLTMMGDRLGGFIYGTVVVIAAIVPAAKAYPDDSLYVALVALATCVVLWLAHVYAHALGESVAHGERLSGGELRLLARREAAVVEAALPPVAALLLGRIGVFSASTAIWVALGLALAVLAAEGLLFARAERLGWAATAAIVAANLAFGGLLVVLKIAVFH
jgi:hypothetical protein